MTGFRVTSASPRRARALSLAALASLVLAGAGCSKESAANPAAGGPGGRNAGIVVAATDVGVVRHDTVEASVAITGDLLPIEQVQVKARLEGDLEGVYVREGDRVRAGQLLARFESSEQESDRASAEAERAAARNELQTAQWNLEQSRELFQAGAIPERDHRIAEQAVATARARVAAADARVRSTGSFVGDTRVLSPTTGIVAERLVENGERVARGAPLFTVVRSDVLELAAAVPARQAGDIRAGQVVRFTADGRRIEGRVARVSPTVDRASRSVQVYVQVPNPTGAIKGNTFATGRVIGRTAPGALVVPTTALRQAGDDGRTFVFRLAGDVLEQVAVSLGIIDEARGVAEVVQGLQAGDRVIVGNVGALGSGMKVTIAGERNERTAAAGAAGGPPAGR